MQDLHEVKKPHNKRFKATKKIDCPAKVTIKKIVKFPDFKVSYPLMICDFVPQTTRKVYTWSSVGF